MRKVLIFLREDSIMPKGGPSGYVYNLLKGIKDDSVEISLLPPSSNKTKLKSKYDKLPLCVKSIYRIWGRYNEFKKISVPTSGITTEYLNSFDAIHFHSCFSLYKNLKLLKEYKGKVLLTSHCPKPPHREMIEDMYSNFERKLYGEKHLKVFENAAEASFDRADYIIFPCEEAEEPYINGWSKYNLIKERNKHKYLYMPTGVDSCLEKVKLTRNEIRNKYNIPNDAFLISYVGRHNTVKGYDNLKKIASTFSKNDNVYFLIAGEEAPLKRPNLSFWIEAGWTKDPYSLEAASDIFVLPNKETYFDLVLLEVLSLGVKVLISNTGGNKFFKKYDCEDIHYFSDVNEAVQKIYDLKKKKNNISNTLNRQLYLKYFTSENFANNYIKILKGIL